MLIISCNFIYLAEAMCMKGEIMVDSVLAQLPLTVASQLVQQTSVQIEQQKEAAASAAKEEEQKISSSSLQSFAPISDGDASSSNNQSSTDTNSERSSADGLGEKVDIET